MSKPSHIEYLQALQQMSFSSCSHPDFCTNASDILFYFHGYCTPFFPDLFLLSETWDGSSYLKSVLHTLQGLSLDYLTYPGQPDKNARRTCGKIFLLLAKA